MNEFEQLVRKRWDNRYNLTKDIEGYYSSKKKALEARKEMCKNRELP